MYVTVLCIQPEYAMTRSFVGLLKHLLVFNQIRREQTIHAFVLAHKYKYIQTKECLTYGWLFHTYW